MLETDTAKQAGPRSAESGGPSRTDPGGITGPAQQPTATDTRQNRQRGRPTSRQDSRQDRPRSSSSSSSRQIGKRDREDDDRQSSSDDGRQKRRRSSIEESRQNGSRLEGQTVSKRGDEERSKTEEDRMPAKVNPMTVPVSDPGSAPSRTVGDNASHSNSHDDSHGGSDGGSHGDISSSDWGEFCRICHEGGDKVPLVTACRCTGSMKHVHNVSTT